MKRIPFSVIAFLPVLCALSCASAPVPEEEPYAPSSPAEPLPVSPEPAPTIEEVYEKYSGDIILEGAQTHRVKRGETLSAVTRAYYGGPQGYYFPLILLASRDVAKDPDRIMPGMDLTVPDLSRNLNDPGARQKLKEFLHEVADVYDKRLNKNWGAESRNQLRALASSL